MYLGLPISGDAGCLMFWELVLYRIKNRLSGWKSRLFSFDGRLVPKVSLVFSACLCTFLFQNSLRYNIFYSIFIN